MTAATLVVLAMGLRHGADPDHLAAIDNLTRNSVELRPRTSRFVGALFAIGHSAMVVLLAVVAASLGSRIVHTAQSFASVGALGSIAVLLLMAALNVVTLLRGGNGGLRTRLLPKALREATHPLVAIPIGALFGLGFETSSQLVAYGVAFSSAHLIDGLEIGMAFCAGMICTDTFDSMFVARVIATKRINALRARQTWIIVVTIIALAVAAEQLVEFLGYPLPFDELSLSAATVGLLIVAALFILFGNRADRST